MDDAAGFFANVFGGERFVDYVRILQRMEIYLMPILYRSAKYLL